VAGGVALLQQQQHRGPAQGKVEVGDAGAAPPERATARWPGLQPTGGLSAEQVQRGTGGHETPVGRGHAQKRGSPRGVQQEGKLQGVR
jgi:hypothetical protein